MESLTAAVLLGLAWCVLAAPCRLAGTLVGRVRVLRRVRARAERERWMAAWMLPVWVGADEATILRARTLRDDWQAAREKGER